MGISEIKEAIRSTVALLSGCNTYWENQRRPFVNPSNGVTCLLNVSNIETVGTDDFTYTTNVLTGKLDITQRANRVISLTVLVEDYMLREDNEAEFIASNISEGLTRRQISEEYLRPHGITLHEVSDIRALPTVMVDGHAVVYYTCDITFGALLEKKSTDAGVIGLDPIGWIDVVEVTDNITG